MSYRGETGHVLHLPSHRKIYISLMWGEVYFCCGKGTSDLGKTDLDKSEDALVF